MVASTPAQDTASLKRLGFVNDYASKGAQLTSSVYSTSRSYVPGFVEPYVRTAEEKATSISAPYLTWAQDSTAGVVKAVDGQLDATYNAVNSGVKYSSDLHANNMQVFSQAKEEYFNWVETNANKLKGKLNPYPYAEMACKKLKDALDYAVTIADPDLALDTVHEAWTKFASIGPVAKLLDLSEPLTNTAEAQYTKAHDAVVKMPVYKKAYNTIGSTLSAVQENFFFQKAKDMLYPVIAPVANPIYENFANSKYLAKLQKHVTPQLP